jgi:hypothetical protein
MVHSVCCGHLAVVIDNIFIDEEDEDIEDEVQSYKSVPSSISDFCRVALFD